MPLRFHHFFAFTSPGAPEVDTLVRAGFLEGSRNRHPGQGTANRRIFFENGMIEFIWVEDEAEARSPLTAPTRLLERSRWRETGFSPFGVALESDPPVNAMSPDLPFAANAYRPTYLPKRAVIWNARNDAQPWEPMIFLMPAREDLPARGNLPAPSHTDPAPREGARAPEPTAHPIGARLIRRVRIWVPRPAGTASSEAIIALGSVAGVEILEGTKFKAEVQLEGSAQIGAFQLLAIEPGQNLRLSQVAR